MSKRQLTGAVVSNKMQKTVIVRIEKIKEHSKYKKRFKAFKKYKAHAEEAFQMGDRVIIEECKPISKEKHWKIIKKI